MKMEIGGEMKAIKVDRLSEIRKLYRDNVIPSYARFDLALDHGDRSYIYDVAGKRYLDLGGGIAVCALGHANPEIADALLEQSRKLLHVSNLYFTKPQAQLAEALVRLIGPGRCFLQQRRGSERRPLQACAKIWARRRPVRNSHD